ncbi:hypothetical protein GCM10009609_65530 [Pseudonocardia aurantiaca]
MERTRGSATTPITDTNAAAPAYGKISPDLGNRDVLLAVSGDGERLDRPCLVVAGRRQGRPIRERRRRAPRQPPPLRLVASTGRADDRDRRGSRRQDAERGNAQGSRICVFICAV